MINTRKYYKLKPIQARIDFVEIKKKTIIIVIYYNQWTLNNSFAYKSFFIDPESVTKIYVHGIMVIETHDKIKCPHFHSINPARKSVEQKFFE